MPVRKVSNRGGNVIGHFPSLKMQRMIAFESLIERDYLYLLDYELDIEWFAEQPLTIEYRHNGKTLHYTPDFHIVAAGMWSLPHEVESVSRCPSGLINKPHSASKSQ